MSQQYHQVSHENNVYVRYKKVSQEEAKKIRSGILERYTYKTDTGELLKTPLLHATSNRYLIPINSKVQNSTGESSNFCRTNLRTRNKIHNDLGTPRRSYMHHVHTNGPIGNSSKANDEKVRTEHCDSTTDILENFDINSSNLFVSPSKQSDNDNPLRKNSWKRSKVDSDSDCEIIDVKISNTDSHVSKNKIRCPITLSDNITHNSDKEIMSLENLNKDIESLKTKVLDWIAIKPLKEAQSIIHIISDDSDDSSEYLCDKTGLKTKKLQNNKLENNDRKKKSDSNHGSSNEPEKSNISIILQKQNHATKYPTKNSKENISFRSDSKQTIIIQKKDPLQLMNEKLYRIKTKLSREFKSPMISIPSSANCVSKNLSPPKQCSNMLEKKFLKKSPNAKEAELTPLNAHKMHSPKMGAEPLSPESMKSEFYSYLKINTNPSAQKTETIAQNRRSTRVKNLILQIEKNKEQQNIKIEHDDTKKERNDEIRKKFMKYSKPNLVFPSVPLNCYTFADFDPVIEAYFYKEKIPCKLYQSFSNVKNEEDDKDNNENNTAIIVNKKEPKLRRKRFKKKVKKPVERSINKYIQNKLKLQNRMLKKKQRRKAIVTKIIGCTPHVSDIQVRRLRFRPNRGFRDSSKRITRHSLDGFKGLPRKTKVRKSKKNTKIKTNRKETISKINKKKIKNVLEIKIENEATKKSTPESKFRIRDIKTLMSENKSEFLENKAEFTENETKLTITEAKYNHLELKLQTPEPKLTIREVVNKPNTTNSNKSISNKLTITEVKTSTKDLDDNNLKEIDALTSNLVTQIGTVSPNNILLPNLLASKLSLALKKNIPLPQKNKYKNQVFALNSLKSEEPSKSTSNYYFLGFNNTEVISANKNRALSPVCFGFEPDEKSAKICKIMQEVVSNLDTDILVTSNSPIQTPEPIEHLVPEIRINSFPLSNEPCNLQEVMSIVSSGLTSSQDLTPMLQNEDNSSDYSEASSAQEELQMEIVLGELIDPALIEKSNSNVIPLNQNIKTKSFHRSLMQTRVKQKPFLDVYRSNVFEQSDSDSSMATPKANSNKKSLTHGIDINSKGGAMFTTYYVNGILIIVQEFMITFWKQTALGNILGAQNMWLPNGSLQRILLERGCINRRSSEMVLSCENSVAYIELWTKQHESKFRECPIADVFATIYFHRGHGIPDKKVLQLENIKGYGHDVRFVVIKSSRELIVSWCDTFAEPIKTLVRCYQLSPDFQTISSVKEMECINHCLISLHNIQDCDDLVLGAGNEQISVWNLRHGYLVTTLNLADSTIQSSLENKSLLLYAQCDTGFLFLIQQIEVGVLRLVAVNGMTQEWKQLQSYQVPPNYKELLGIIVESGVLMTCYTNGFLCWNMNNGQILAEIEMVDNIVLPTNKHLVAFKNYQVKVQHIMSYILTHDW